MPMTQTDVSKYKNLYVETARKYMLDLQENLTLLLQGKSDDKTIKAVHLAAHSLTSQSQVIGYTNIGNFASTIEKILKAKIAEKSIIREDILQQMQTGVEKMLTSLEEIEKGGEELDMSEELKTLEL